MNATENESAEKEKSSSAGGKRSKRDPNAFPWRVATFVLLFVASGLFYYQNSARKNYKAQLEIHQMRIVEMRNEVRDIKIENTKLNDQLSVITEPDFLKIVLHPLSNDIQYHALLYWNEANQELYLDPTKLPAIDEEKQYQLWNLSNAEPTDLGTVLTGDIGFQQMKNSPNSNNFLLTLEPIGGSVKPNMEQVICLSD